MRVLFLILGFLLLSACQSSNEVEDEQPAKEVHRDKAAGYNIQLGLAYLKQGNRPRAKHKLLTALEQAPDSPEANAAMGYYLEQSGDKVEAKRFYQQAMAHATIKGPQFNNYGAFLCREGKYQEADSYFMKAVKDVHYDHTAAAYENAGLCAMAIPDYAKAKTYYLKALEQDPSRKQSLYELVKLEIKQNDLKQALAYLDKYPELSLSDKHFLMLGADAAHQLGNVALEANYRFNLNKINQSSDTAGVKNAYNNNNG